MGRSNSVSSVRWPLAAPRPRPSVIVVSLPVASEGVGQVQHRLAEHAALGQRERRQQTADVPVPIQERVDRLELDVGERDPNEHRKPIVLVQEAFEVAERFGTGRSVRRRRPRCMTRTPPAVVHGTDGVDDLLDIVRSVRVEDLAFGGERVLKRALRPLDQARSARGCARSTLAAARRTTRLVEAGRERSCRRPLMRGLGRHPRGIGHGMRTRRNSMERKTLHMKVPRSHGVAGGSM